MVPFESFGMVFCLQFIVPIAISLPILEIFGVKEWCDLDIWVWITLQNHVTDGSKHMRQLDRGDIKLFSLCCLYASSFNSF